MWYVGRRPRSVFLSKGLRLKWNFIPLAYERKLFVNTSEHATAAEETTKSEGLGKGMWPRCQLILRTHAPQTDHGTAHVLYPTSAQLGTYARSMVTHSRISPIQIYMETHSFDCVISPHVLGVTQWPSMASCALVFNRGG